MSKAKWTGAFGYSATDFSISGVMPKIEFVGLGAESVPISYFSVTGGPKRRVDLGATDDMSLTSELEQARRYKNIRLYLSPKSVFSSGELIQLATKNITFKMSVNVTCRVGNTVMQSVLFGSGDARIVETPRRLNDSSGNGYFFVYLQFTESALIYISPPGRDQRFEVW